MTLRVTPYRSDDAEPWDALCARSPMATLLHTRRFLSYHGERFADRSLVLRDDGDRIVGLLPAAQWPGDDKLVVSHPGATFGGLVHEGRLSGGTCVDALVKICESLAAMGYEKLLYKAVPHIYHRNAAADDLYAISVRGGRLCRRDLSAAVDLDQPAPRSQRRRRGLRRAQTRGVRVEQGTAHLAELWQVLEDNLRARHGVAPVHALDEMRRLADRFPAEIRVFTALLDGAVAAGTVLFCAPRCHHAQYIAASDAGRDAHALDAVFDTAIEAAGSAGARFFDFGISTEEQGRRLNDGLYRFKTEFGGGGIVHDFYEIDLG